MAEVGINHPLYVVKGGLKAWQVRPCGGRAGVGGGLWAAWRVMAWCRKEGPQDH